MDKYLNKKQVLEIACTTNSTLYRWIANGDFPKPCGMSNTNRNSGVKWKQTEIQEWFDSRTRRLETSRNGVVSVDLKSGSQQS